MLRPMNTLAELQHTNAVLSSCGCNSAQKIVRKYKKAHKRRLQKKEYRNLQRIVPTVASKGKISKVTVIEEAIRYIDELHNSLAQRLQSSQGLRMPISADAIQEFAQQSFLAKKQGSELPITPLHLLLPTMAPVASSNPQQTKSMTQR